MKREKTDCKGPAKVAKSSENIQLKNKNSKENSRKNKNKDRQHQKLGEDGATAEYKGGKLKGKRQGQTTETKSDCEDVKKKRSGISETGSKRIDDSLTGENSAGKDGKRKLHSKKKKQFNMEAIERMKANQLAKREKASKQKTASPKSDDKQRRPKQPVYLKTVDLQFTEDDTMTEFEGVWIMREDTGRLAASREDLQRRSLPADKTARTMKQLMRRYHRKLKLHLIGRQVKTERVARERQQFLEKQTPRPRRRLPGRACGLKLEEGERLAKFDGYWVGADAVAGLQKLREQLKADGKSEADARRLLRKARRVEERRIKRTGRLLCVRCGNRGHLGSDCTAPSRQAAVGTACFRCGAAGHRLSDCPEKADTAHLPFATCYRCQQRGHMSRDCPQAREAAAVVPDRTRPGAARTGQQSWRGLAFDADGTASSANSKVVVSKVKAPKQHIQFE